MPKGKTFLGKIISRVGSFIRSFLNRIDPETKRLAELAIALTNGVKTFIDSPVGEFTLEGLKALIPGNLDDKAINWLNTFVDTKLPDIIIRLKLIKEVAEISDPVEKAIRVINFMKTVDPSERTGFIINLSGAILEALEDGKITAAEAVVILQIIYHNKKE